MDELVSNPDGCKSFLSNPFKKEKCKNCGRIWKEHKGVINEQQRNSFVEAQLKVLAETAKKEEEVKAKARAKKIAKKQQEQAPEDRWLFDEGLTEEQGMNESSDDELGFRMFSRENFESAPIEKRHTGPESSKALKVVNLIDFSECDVPEEEEAHEPQPSPVNRAVAPAPPPPQVQTEEKMFQDDPVNASNTGKGRSAPLSLFGTPAASMEEELMSEIQHLRQMLDDANEEKNIQVAIIKDEVAEKQQQLEEAKRQHAETQDFLETARVQVERYQRESIETGGEVAEAEHLAMIEQERQEIDGLKRQCTEKDNALNAANERIAALESNTRDLEALRKVGEEQTKELERCRKENEDLAAQCSKVQVALEATRVQAEKGQASELKRDDQSLEVERLKGEIKVLMERCAQAEEQRDELEASAEAARAKVVHAEHQATQHDNTKELDRQREEIRLLTQRCTEAEESVRRAEHKKSLTTRENGNAGSERHRQELAELTRKHAEMEASVRAAHQQEIADLKDRDKAHRREAGEQRAEIDKLTRQLGDSNTSLQACAEKLSALESSRKPVSVVEEKGDVDQLRQEVTRLQGQVDRLRSELAVQEGGERLRRMQEERAEGRMEAGEKTHADKTQNDDRGDSAIGFVGAHLTRNHAEEARGTEDLTSATVSHTTAALIVKLHDLCARTRQTLGDGNGAGSSDRGPGSIGNVGNVDGELRGLRNAFVAVHVAAERVEADRRQLATKLRDFERDTAQSPSVVSLTQSPSMSSPKCDRLPPAQALRELRLDAERQFAWITKRIRMSHEAGGLPDCPMGSPQVEAA